MRVAIGRPVKSPPRSREAWSQALYFLVAVVATVPAWIVARPPIQDLPYHLATIRVIHSLHDPAYGLGDFALTLGNTPYLGYYLVADVLSYVVGVTAANTILVCGYLAGTLYALRALLRATDRPELLSLLALPLLVNRLFVIGLLPFLLGIPLMLAALAFAVRFVRAPRLGSGLGVAALALALFFVHVVPFGLFVIGFAGMVATRPWRGWSERLLPLAPAALIAFAWLRLTPAGKWMLEGGGQQIAFGAKVARVTEWLTYGAAPAAELWALGALAALVVVAFILGSQRPREASDSPIARAERGLLALPVACVALYFLSPEGHDYVWPIAGRFPFLLALTIIPFLRMPARAGAAVATVAVAIGLFTTGLACQRFVAFQRDELGDLEGVIASIPPRMHVAAIDGASRSSLVVGAPLLHAGSYYQLEKGGVVAFTFAGYPHWPFAFRTSAEPPTGPRFPWGWEWRAHAPRELASYYDYVITRDAGWGSDGSARDDGDRGAAPAAYALHFSDASGWRVWKRVEPAEGAPAAALGHR
jgi:hypothetical protein